ncbi:hypothetical protein LXL04_007446 [Taraxacum kok-saghyz]
MDSGIWLFGKEDDEEMIKAPHYCYMATNSATVKFSSLMKNVKLLYVKSKKLVDDNVRLNTVIERLRYSADRIEIEAKMTQNFNHPWSK